MSCELNLGWGGPVGDYIGFWGGGPIKGSTTLVQGSCRDYVRFTGVCLRPSGFDSGFRAGDLTFKGGEWFELDGGRGLLLRVPQHCCNDLVRHADCCRLGLSNLKSAEHVM